MATYSSKEMVKTHSQLSNQQNIVRFMRILDNSNEVHTLLPHNREYH